MRTRNRTTITIERERLLVIRDRGSKYVPCEICRTEVAAFDVEHSARIANVPPEEILGRIENGELHFTRLSDGSFMVCLKSLQRSLFGG